MHRLVYVLIAVLTLGANAFCQDPASFAPPKEIANLSWMLGKWSGTHTFHEPGGKSSTTKAAMTFDLYLGKRFVRGSFTGVVGGIEMEGLHLTTFDPQTKSWKGWWFDSIETGVMEVEGTLKNGVLSQVSKPVEMPGMGPQTYRTTYAKVDARHMKFKLEVKSDSGWTTMMEGAYTKK